MRLTQEIDSSIIKNTKIKKITTINVENVPCYCFIGIHEEEKKMGQKLFVDACVDVDLSGALNSDNILDALSYVDIYKYIQRVGQLKSYSLIEVLAEKIAESILEHHLVSKVKIKVHKPHIPFPEFQGDVSVEVERTR